METKKLIEMMDSHINLMCKARALVVRADHEEFHEYLSQQIDNLRAMKYVAEATISPKCCHCGQWPVPQRGDSCMSCLFENGGGYGTV